MQTKNKQVHLLLKVRDSVNTKALKKVELHKEIADKFNFSWYGLNSNISEKTIKNLCSKNALVLFYINTRKVSNTKSGIVYTGRLKDFEVFSGNKKIKCSQKEIPSNFKDIEHKLFLKISKFKQNRNISIYKFKSLNNISLKNIRSGLSRVIPK